MLAVALVAVTAHSALMSGPTDDHAMGDATALCFLLGGSLAAVGVAAFGIRRPARHRTWVIHTPVAPALPFIPSSPGFLVRAGPPSLLQVFRL